MLTALGSGASCCVQTWQSWPEPLPAGSASGHGEKESSRRKRQGLQKAATACTFLPSRGQGRPLRFTRYRPSCRH